MNKDRLFEYVATQKKAQLIELLESAFDAMDTEQRHDVFDEDFFEKRSEKTGDQDKATVSGDKFEVSSRR
jgi:hypothetical protein